MNAHTPGPWKQGYNPSDGHFTILESKMGGRCIGVAFGPIGPRETTEAAEDNAKLIAAAPAMLDALRGLFEHCAMVHKQWGDGSNQREADAAIKAAHAAIAQAKGR